MSMNGVHFTRMLVTLTRLFCRNTNNTSQSSKRLTQQTNYHSFLWSSLVVEILCVFWPSRAVPVERAALSEAAAHDDGRDDPDKDKEHH
jgi:hypothetical protein